MSSQHNPADALRRRKGSSETDTLHPDSPEPHSSESFVSEPNSNKLVSSESSKMELTESELYKPASETETEQDYRQYLYRLFGKETADYFLDPSSDHREASAWYNLLIEHMGEQVSAVALWEALREHSNSTLAKLEEEEAANTKVSLVCGGHQRERGHLRRRAGVRTMFHLAQLRQAFSAQLIASKPQFLPTD